MKTSDDLTPAATSVELRVRAALDSGEAPAAADVAALLEEIERTRMEAEERWQAITRLAPAAKRHRMRAHSAARESARLASHLDQLDRILASAPPALAETLRAWRDEAHAILADAQSNSP